MSNKQLSYRDAAEFLKKHPEEIKVAWNRPNVHPAGGLFRFLTSRLFSDECGCPTMVKSGKYFAETEELTELVLKSNIPTDLELITQEDLDEFVRIQEAADRLLGRKPPEAD